MKYHTLLFPQCLAVSFMAFMLACGGRGDADRTAGVDTSATAIVKTTATSRVVLVPGLAAGPFKLDDPDHSVLKQLGQPDHSDAAMGKAVLIWYTDSPEQYPLSIFTARDMGNDDTARIQQIRVTSPTFETAESIHVGSTLTDIRNAYQVEAVETYDLAGATYTVYDAEEGIAFEVGPEESCVAIIIHPIGAGRSSYLPLRPAD